MSDTVLVVDIEAIKDAAVMPPDWGADRWPPPLGWRVIAIGLLAATRSPEGYAIEKVACGTGDERSLLEKFWTFVDRRQPLIVTWNGRGFDLPVLLHRAMLHKIQARAWFSGSRTETYGYRYSADGHCDLMDQLTDYGAVQRTSLGLVAAALGLAGKSDIDGSQIEALFQEGRMGDIAAYCETDVLNLYGVFLRWAHLTGRIDHQSLDRSMARWHEFLAREGRERLHLAQFAAASPALKIPAPPAIAAGPVEKGKDLMLQNAPYDADTVRKQDIDHHFHPFTDFSTFKDSGSLILAEASGAYVIDTAGNRYLDGIGGLWCVNIGYGREEMAQALAQQARQMVYYSSFGHHTSVPAAQLAAKIAGLAPGSLKHVFYGTGGSVANDTAVRMIHFYFNRLGKPDKKKIITRHDGYHGSTYLTMSLTGVAFDHIGFDLIGGDLIHRVSAPNCYRRPDGMSEEQFLDHLADELSAKIDELGAERVAAFFAEPIMGAGGVVVPPKGYHQRFAEICRRNEILYVADEVVTGFGRLGHFFASEAVFGMVPDIITSAKGLTSAYAPLSATILSEPIYEVLSVPQAKGAMFTHGFTYSGHPVCCAAGLKNIEIMEREDICGRVRRDGPYFEQRLGSLRDLPLVGDVRGSHFMLCVENVADKATKELLPAEAAVGKRIAEACQRRGVLVRPLGHLNILSPPLILTRNEIDRLVDVLREAIIEVTDALSAEGHRL
jgi:adenosylmethionine-8-amino-7-oxononanoate aminotransferase/predicted PolB exonuclease-like 3'-5' exonuclease